MKPHIVLCALAISVSAAAEEWVSVGAAPAVAPASSSEAVASPSTSPVVINSQAAENDSSLVNEMLMQMDQMQQEIASLREQLEQQGNLIRELRQDSDNRYLDLDRRIVFLTTETEQQAVEQAATAAPVNGQSAEQAYSAAMQLVRDKKFEQANQAFDQFVQQYPDSELVANAYYWNGEILLVRGQFDSALTNFKTVVDQYPQHGKAADASYKYGVTLHRSGKDEESRQWLQKVIEQYKDSAPGTVRLAEAYLKKLSVNP
ncbi:tol-pal system protein YbgF [Oceanobacter mangrovi]|uniref:tol-pal system protein YbgF n=1 Tax=Oceanobacter mangrovi TaxID=2862510 RepID=UPI001C8DB42C|nr:tol-pal system protein YbgF [Oceanobacter mangrovi]